MLYLVVSDLHGSKRGMERIQGLVKKHQPDCLLLLGDILHGGYDVDEEYCVRGLKEIGIPVLAVEGNCDFRWDANQLGFPLPELRRLSFSGHEFHLSHHPSYLSFPPGSVLVNGHTHRKELYSFQGVIHLNPGSIALPRDDGPGYALIKEGVIELRNAYDDALITSLDL